jgi:hypothetical protein
MPAKKSNPQKKSPDKKKRSPASRAASKISARPRTGERVRVPGGEKVRSQGRFPGETALTGEDRPAHRAGGKKQQRGTTRTTAARPRNAPLGARTPSKSTTARRRGAGAR